MRNPSYNAGAEWLSNYYRGDIDYLDALEIATGIINAASDDLHQAADDIADGITSGQPTPKEDDMDTRTLIKALSNVADVAHDEDVGAYITALENALGAALDIVEYYAVPHDESADFDEARMGALGLV